MASNKKGFDVEIIERIISNPLGLNENGIWYKRVSLEICGIRPEYMAYDMCFSVLENEETTFWNVLFTVDVGEIPFTGTKREKVYAWRVKPVEKTIIVYEAF